MLLTLLILNLALYIVDGVRALHLQGDGLASQCLDEDLHVSCRHKGWSMNIQVKFYEAK